MEFTVYKLHFKSPLHIADEKQEYSISHRFIHSDTLYAAFCEILSEIGAEIPDGCEFPFYLSSLFPFYQDESNPQLVRYFFPVPNILKTVELNEEQLLRRKLFKKVRWADLQRFEQIISGKQLTEFDDQLFNGSFLTDLRPVDFLQSDIVPRVTIKNRTKNESDIFFVERIYFKLKSGLFFIAIGENLQMIDKLLDVLKLNGIGTDKNLGFGRFDYTKDTIRIKLPSSSLIMNLSLFLPNTETDKSLIQKAKSYNIIRRSGWITTFPYQSLRKNSVYMFAEASVFEQETTDKPLIKGTITDITPQILKGNFSVFRNGKAIFIPVKL